MASELPKERNRWGDNIKVYTRKFKPKKINLDANGDDNNNDNVDNIIVVDNNNSLNEKLVADVVSANENNDNDNDDDDDDDNGDNISVGVVDNNNSLTEKHVVDKVVSANNNDDDNDNDNGNGNGNGNGNVSVVDIDKHVVDKVVCADNNNNTDNDDDNDNVSVVDIDNSLKDKHVRIVVTANNRSGDSGYEYGDKGKNDCEIETETVDNRENLEPPLKVVVEEANLSQPQPNSPLPQQNSSRLGTASGDSTSFDRVEVPPLSNGKLVNGLDSRQLVMQVEDTLNISVSAARSKEEVKDLKRKLEDELDQVREMAKRLKEKEVMISGYPGIDVGTTVPAVGHLPFPVNGGMEAGVGDGSMRLGSDMSPAPFRGSRPFNRLSVSVMNNNHHYGVVGDVVEKEKRTPKANQYYQNSDFLLGKDKLPPESNRKTKSAGSKKRGGGESDHGLRIDKKIFSKCNNLLQKIMNHKHGWVFNSPVDVKGLGLHDYYDIIKHPMDLGTVKARLTKNWYKTPREFAEDLRLTFHNAMTYNPVGQDVHVMAQELLRIFEEKWPSIEIEYDRKMRYEMMYDMGLPTPTSRKTYAPARVSVPMSFAQPPLLHPPPSSQEVRNLERSQSMPVRPQSRPVYSVGRKPAPKKPKAKDPHKRDMTFEEKQKLSTNLQNLPSEKLDAVVQIIKRTALALSHHDDEIEVDIDSVDTETLWELDRFVMNYKKNLSKRKRKAELAQARAAKAAQEIIPAPANVEVTRETVATMPNSPPNQAIAAASPRVQQERHNENDGDSTSSSSSSGDSGSSSSDSDSDSSSSSESEGGH